MYVIFDSNAYLNLAARKWLRFEIIPFIKRLNKIEEEKGIKKIFNQTVARELLSHLLDDGGGSTYEKACTALYKHCGDSISYRSQNLPEVELAQFFFHQVPSSSISTEKTIGYILYCISEATKKKKEIKKYQNQIEQIRSEVSVGEETLANEVEKLFQSYDSNFKMGMLPFGNNSNLRKKFLAYINSSQFQEDTAAAIICSIHMYLIDRGVKIPQLTPSQVQKLSNLYIQTFPIPLKFREMYYQKFSSSCFDLRRDGHSNYIWDEYILMCVGQQIKGDTILLVTTDGDMYDVAKAVNPNAPIMTYQEYLNMLGIAENSTHIHRLLYKLKKRILKFIKNNNKIKSN